MRVPIEGGQKKQGISRPPKVAELSGVAIIFANQIVLAATVDRWWNTHLRSNLNLHDQATGCNHFTNASGSRVAYWLIDLVGNGRLLFQEAAFLFPTQAGAIWLF